MMSCPSERRHSKSQLAIFSDFYRVRLKNEKRKTAVGEQNSPLGARRVKEVNPHVFPRTLLNP